MGYEMAANLLTLKSASYSPDSSLLTQIAHEAAITGPEEATKFWGGHHKKTLQILEVPVTTYVLIFWKSGGASGTPGTPGSAGPDPKKVQKVGNLRISELKTAILQSLQNTKLRK